MKVWELEEGKEYMVNDYLVASKYKMIGDVLYTNVSKYSEEFIPSEILYNRVMEYDFIEHPQTPIDWSKVKTDDKVLINGTIRRYFAKYEDGLVYTFKDSANSWSSGNDILNFGSLEYWRESRVKLYIES